MGERNDFLTKIIVGILSAITIVAAVILGINVLNEKQENTNNQGNNQDIVQNDNNVENNNVKNEEDNKDEENNVEDDKTSNDEQSENKTEQKDDSFLSTSITDVIVNNKNNNSSNNIINGFNGIINTNTNTGNNNNSNNIGNNSGIINNNNNNSNSNINNNTNNNGGNNSNNNTGNSNNSGSNSNSSNSGTVIYKNLVIAFSVDGNNTLSFSNVINVNVTGNYKEGTVYYAISDSNVRMPSKYQFQKYFGKITLSNLNGIYYVWASVEGKDGKTVYKVSKAFNMKKYTNPVITYTQDGISSAKSATTRINVTGDYKNIEYAISTNADYTKVTSWNRYTLGSDIKIPNNQGNVYVITRVQKAQDSSYVYKVSNVFVMSSYITPQISFTQNGTTGAKVATTKINVTGDYRKVEYAISTNADYTKVSSWNGYTLGSDIKIPNNQGNVYVITRVQKTEDFTYVYKVSNVFVMSPYITPVITYTQDGTTGSKGITTKINVTGDYKNIEYAISTSADYSNVTSWNKYTLGSELKISNNQGNVYVITRVQKTEDSTYVYKVSKVFVMLPYEIPVISFTQNGTTGAKEITTKINVTGDYKKVEYVISTSADYASISSWNTYTNGSELKISNAQGNVYVIARAQKTEDSTYVYKVSNVFVMLPYETPTVTFSTNGSVSANIEYNVTLAITGDYQDVFYAVSTATTSESVSASEWVRYNGGETIKVLNANGNKVYLYVKLTDKKTNSVVYYKTNSFATLPLITVTGAGEYEDEPDVTDYKVKGLRLNIDISNVEKISYVFTTTKNETTGTWDGISSELIVKTGYEDTTGIKEKSITFTIKFKNGTTQTCVKDFTI